MQQIRPAMLCGLGLLGLPGAQGAVSTGQGRGPSSQRALHSDCEACFLSALSTLPDFSAVPG